MEYDPELTLPLNGTFVVKPAEVTPGIARIFSVSRDQNMRRAGASG
jgi:hypothetical protein